MTLLNRMPRTSQGNIKSCRMVS